MRRRPSLARTRRHVWLVLLVAVVFLTGCAAQPIAVPNREVPVSEEAAQAFEEKLAHLGNLPNGEVKLTFSEAEVTSYLRLRVVPDLPVPVSQLTVWFSGGHVYLAARLKPPAIPVEAHALVVLTALARDGRIDIRVRRAAINGVSLPFPLLQRLSAAANSRVRNAMAPLRVRDIQVLEGEITIVVGR